MAESSISSFNHAFLEEMQEINEFNKCAEYVSVKCALRALTNNHRLLTLSDTYTEIATS